MSLVHAQENSEILFPHIKNEVLRGIKDHTIWPDGARILIVDPGEYRASSSIGMMAALVEAGIEPTDFEHIIFASSGSFAGMGFALWRMPEMVKYCEEHSPRETLRFRDITKRSILKVEQLLSGVLTGKKITKTQDWYDNPVLPENYHAPRPDGKKNPVIHVVTTTTTDDPPKPHYIRSDSSTPQDFQAALSATLVIPRWSEVDSTVWGKRLIDGFFSDPVMYDYARELGWTHIVKLGNHNGPHLTPEGGGAMLDFWLQKFPFLAKFYAKKRPHDIHQQMQRMYNDEEKWAVKVLFAEPLPDTFENPLLTGRRMGFYENILAGLQAMRSMLLDEKYTLPELRTVKEKTLFDTLQEALEAMYNYYWIGK